MGKRAIMLMVAMLVGALLIVGCGGDDDNGTAATSGADGAAAETESSGDSSGGGDASADGGDSDADGGEAPSAELADDSVSKAEFVERANEICQAALTGLQEEFKDGGADLVTATLGVLRSEVEGMEEIGTPDTGADQVEELLRNTSKVISMVESAPDRISPANQLLAKAEKQADAYGMERCLITK